MASSDFTEAFCAARDRLEYLDDIDQILAFPALYVAVETENLRPMRDLYFGFLGTVATEPMGNDLPIIELAKRICSIRDDAQDIEDVAWGRVTAMVHGQPPPLAKELGKLAYDIKVAQGDHRASAYDLLALVNYGVPISDLWNGTEDGDEDQFLKLVRIDKSAMTTDAGARFVRKKQLLGDWEFFKKLAAAIEKHPVDKRRIKPRAVVLTARFWRDGFESWKRDDIADFLVEHDVLPDSFGARQSFLKSIKDLHLTHDRPGRPKMGG